MASHKIAAMQQANLILSMIQQLLDEASLSLNELDYLAYGCGPGSFTGVRLATSVVQGLGYAHSLPIIPISSLAAMAQEALLTHQTTHALVAVDARMAEVYWAAYVINQSSGLMELIDQEHLYKPESVIIPSNIQLDSAHWHGLGDAWETYGTQLTNAIGRKPSQIFSNAQATARAIILLAQQKLAQGERGIAPHEAVARYLR